MSTELATQNDLIFAPENLTKETIKKYLCKLASEQELIMGLQIAKEYKLNPLKREIYFIKFSEEPMQVVLGYEVFTKRADRTGKYAGLKTWTEGKVEDKSLKGCVEITVKGWEKPLYHEVEYIEYVGLKKDGTVNKFWKTKPKTMIKKVAMAQGFKLAFPDEFAGMPPIAEEIEDNNIVDVEIDSSKSRVEQIVAQQFMKEEDLKQEVKDAPKQESKPKAEEKQPKESGKAKGKKDGKDGTETSPVVSNPIAQGTITTIPEAKLVDREGKPTPKWVFEMGDSKFGTFDKQVFECICAIIDKQGTVPILIQIEYKERPTTRKDGTTAILKDIVSFKESTIEELKDDKSK